MIITLTGSNAFRLQEELSKLQSSFIATYGDVAHEKLDGEESSAERLVEAVQSLPFLTPKKLVVLRNPSAQKQFTDNIESIIKGIPETTDVVIVEAKIDKRSSYFKVLKTQTEFKEFSELDPRELSNWIVQYAKQGDGQIRQADAAYLVERAGQNQQLLANEVDKLLNFDSQINRQTIDNLTEPTPQSTIFELLDAAFAGNGKRTLALYKEQRALRVEPQQIMAMIAWQLHILALVKTAGERTPEDTAKEARLNPYVVRKTHGIARKLTLTEVKHLVSRALKLDVRMKSESIDADEALQHFLLTIVSKS